MCRDVLNWGAGWLHPWTRTGRCSFGSLFLSMVCRDSAMWEIFILFTMWTKYNSLRGGKKESRNRTDSFESEPLDKRSPAPFFTTYPRTSTTTTSFILSGPSFFIVFFHLASHFIQFHLPPTSTYSTSTYLHLRSLWPFWGIFSVKKVSESLTHNT